jgi:hypothetical protein
LKNLHPILVKSIKSFIHRFQNTHRSAGFVPYMTLAQKVGDKDMFRCTRLTKRAE